MWRNIASNALTLFIVILIGLGGFIGWAQSQYRGEGPLAEAICVRVPSGATMYQVSQDLADQGAISNARIFRVGADYAGKSGDLKAGSFLVQPGSSMESIVDIVTRAGQNTCGTEIVYRISVNSTSVVVRELDPATERFVELANFDPAEDAPEVYETAKARGDTDYRVVTSEGATSWQITEGLNAIDILTGSAVAVPDEGYLAPGSYEITRGADRGTLLAEMEALQRRRLAEAWANRSDDLPIDTPEEALILASIIEKETSVPDERRQVASVFVNRLNQDMRLQTDPTVIYGITRGQGVLGRGLRQSELNRETPYNTYVIRGLPPTPIANPGLASIEAALNPDETPYIFFVADGTGGHAFAETLAEHNENVARWRAIEAERANQ